MKELLLRDYQSASVDGLRDGIVGGHRKQILCAPTGSGKSVCAVHLVKEASKKGTRTAFVVDRISLVDQISQMFSDYGIDHGVIQADHWRFAPQEPVQVISSGTLARRDLSDMPPFQLLINDECHVVIKAALRMMNDNPKMKVVGLTASPFSKGLGDIYSNIVNVTTQNKLVAEGWLVGPKIYAARKIDMKGAKLKADGEWEPTDIERRSMSIVGDIVEGYIEKTQKHFGGPVKTLLFSATVAHGEMMCQKFQAAGLNFRQVSYLDGNDQDRRDLIAEFREPNSSITGLVSCEALGRGFDVPDIKCLICARPYRKSLSSWVQQLGRGLRPYPGKEFCLVLDHSGNWIRFEEDYETFSELGIHDLHQTELDTKIRKEPEENHVGSACKGCGYILSPKDTVCPSCGKERPKRQNTIKHANGELVEVKKSATKEWMKDEYQAQREFLGYCLERKHGDRKKAEAWAFASYKSITGKTPPRYMADIEPLPPSREVSRAIEHSLIRYVKGKGRHENSHRTV